MKTSYLFYVNHIIRLISLDTPFALFPHLLFSCLGIAPTFCAPVIHNESLPSAFFLLLGLSIHSVFLFAPKIAWRRGVRKEVAAAARLVRCNKRTLLFIYSNYRRIGAKSISFFGTLIKGNNRSTNFPSRRYRAHRRFAADSSPP
jgi:hypothetical protein